jgi:hypothetical protein
MEEDKTEEKLASQRQEAHPEHFSKDVGSEVPEIDPGQKDLTIAWAEMHQRLERQLKKILADTFFPVRSVTVDQAAVEKMVEKDEVKPGAFIPIEPAWVDPGLKGKDAKDFIRDMREVHQGAVDNDPMSGMKAENEELRKTIEAKEEEIRNLSKYWIDQILIIKGRVHELEDQLQKQGKREMDARNTATWQINRFKRHEKILHGMLNDRIDDHKALVPIARYEDLQARCKTAEKRVESLSEQNRRLEPFGDAVSGKTHRELDAELRARIMDLEKSLEIFRGEALKWKGKYHQIVQKLVGVLNQS